MTVRTQRHTAVFGYRRHKARFGGPGDVIAAAGADLGLITDSGSDFWAINGSGDLLEINNG